MSGSGIDELMRAREVQNEALTEINTRIEACKESIHNYECLSGRIMTLPDRLSHEVMVPFGKLAFMPGRLTHTNELLVHLGETWFSEMTCKQALKVIEVRQNNLRNTVCDLEKVAKNVESKTEYLGEMEVIAKGKAEEVEIKEECPPAYAHPKDRKRVSRMTEDSEQRQAVKDVDMPEEAHETLMRRLDELERQEEEDEMYRLTDSDDSAGESSDKWTPQSRQTKSRHVKWKDQAGGEPEKGMPKDASQCCTIKFKHTKVQNTHETTVMTPGDVDKLVQKAIPAKSILKKTSKNSYILPSPPNEQVKEKHATTAVLQGTAVSDIVVERSAEAKDTVTKDANPTKPVSRFKAGRKKS